MGQKLGQYSLKDAAKIRKIIEALKIKDGDVIVEIGAGYGELTKKIKNQKSKIKIIAIEKDKELAEILRNTIEINENSIEIIEGDILKILPNLVANHKLQTTNYKLVGNIPYYITGHLLRKIGELKEKPTITVLTIQKEVAFRVCAKPQIYPVRNRPAGGTATAALGRPASNGMNLLAASIQCWADPEIVDFISKKSFSPQPKVDSAIIKLTTLPDADNLTSANYYKLIKILFKQPRKTIKNNLFPFFQHKKSALIDLENVLRESKLKLSDRPQNMSVEIIKKLSEMLYNEAE